MNAAVLFHANGKLLGFIGDAFEDRPHEVRPRGAARDARKEPPAIAPPVWRAQPREGGHEIDAARIGHGGCDKFALGARRDEPEPVAQPLDAAARVEGAAFEGVANLPPEGVADGRDEPALRAHARLPRMEEHEKPRAVSHFAVAARDTPLPEERRLLIARAPRDRHPFAPEHRLSHARVGRAHLGQNAARDRKIVQKLLIP